MEDFSLKRDILKLKESMKSVLKRKVDITKEPDPEKALMDYDEKQKEYFYKLFVGCLNTVKNNSVQLNRIIEYDANNRKPAIELMNLMDKLKTNDVKELDEVVNKMAELAEQIKAPESIEKKSVMRTPSNIPEEIHQDVVADIKELNQCFEAGCHRSVVILCGRILEAILHRKYFDSTGIDLLEKSPGIGLGKIIAKLAEKNIDLDPGLTQQIHLINQVRVFSVHSKQQAFYPSKEQAHAMILYTMDVIGKMF